MNNIKSLKSQRGMTGIGWMIVISLFLFFAYVLMILFPIYLDNYSVKSIISGLSESDESFTSAAKLRRTINKRLDVNAVTSVRAEDITITREADKFLVDIDYEVREPFLGNIDLLFTFKSVENVSASDE